MFYMRSRDMKRAVTTLFLFASVFLMAGEGLCKDYGDVDVRFLDDEAFAAVEKDKKGEKIRHLPHHDSSGKLDNELVIYMLGVFDKEKWLDAKNKIDAKKHLEKHYDKFKSEIMKNELKEPVNINNEKLTGLVRLPGIGPVVAVKIIEYRKSHKMFKDIDEMKKVEGIGQGTFNGIRHYIRAGNP
jgi:competence ComEA-like helix-hairpin-helix protein